MKSSLIPPLAVAMQMIFLCLLVICSAYSWRNELYSGKYTSLSVHFRRQQDGTATNTTLNSTLLEAEGIVKVAQEEARIRNAQLLSSPRRNKYEFRGGLTYIPKDNSTGTGVNDTVADAAALVTEAQATNGSITVSKRQATSYWMAGMTQNGGRHMLPILATRCGEASRIMVLLETE